MADNVDLQLVLKRVDAVLAGQDEIRREQEVVSRKLGTIADGMVSMRKRLDDLDASTRLIAVAVDEHAHRLDGIETRLDGIEKKLDRIRV